MRKRVYPGEQNEKLKNLSPEKKEELRKRLFGPAAGTLPMTTDAATILKLTISTLKLNAENREFLKKAMNLYADLRMAEAAAEDKNSRPGDNDGPLGGG